MRKLLGKPSSTDFSPESGGSAPGSRSGTTITSTSALHSFFPAWSRPAASQDVWYNAGVSITCLDAAPDGRTAVLAGRHILKTVRLEADGMVVRDAVDVRAVITSQATAGGIVVGGGGGGSSSSGGGGGGGGGGMGIGILGANTVADQLSIRDVKWHGESTIFTACANGKIFSYNLAHIGIGLEFEVGQVREDTRQVNTLDINPHRDSYLLSGSQDGYVRCIDIRAPHRRHDGVLAYPAILAFKCNTEGVRQVKWSPKHGMQFACCTEAGTVFKWDLRNPNSPLLRIHGHEKACTTIAWHADGEYLMSAGLDTKCHVWDLSENADKRQKAKYTIKTPAPVSVVAWRPGLWSATARSKRFAQVAVSYDDASAQRYGIMGVHIWDLARPTMPYKVIDRVDRSPSGMLWHDRDILWTAGADGLFHQVDVAYAPKAIDRQTMSTMAFSSRGDVAMFLDERPPPPRPRPSVYYSAGRISRPSYTSHPSTPMLSMSQSDSEDDVVGSFLGPHRNHRRHDPEDSRSSRLSMSTTPPSVGTGTSSGVKEVVGLEQSLDVTGGAFKSVQAMATGHLPAAATVPQYQFLASTYLDVLAKELPYVPESSESMPGRVNSILGAYACAAESAAQYRLAQTWRLLASSMGLLLRRRAQHHFERRLGIFPGSDGIGRSGPHGRKEAALRPTSGAGPKTARKPKNAAHAPAIRPSRVGSLPNIESTSNMPTPLFRPNKDDPAVADDADSDWISLPPAASSFGAVKRRRLDSVPLSEFSQDGGGSHLSSTDGYEFYDTDALARGSMDVPGGQPGPNPRSFRPVPLDRVDGVRADSSSQSHSSSEGPRSLFSNSLVTGSPACTKSGSIVHDAGAGTYGDRNEIGEYESRARGREIVNDSQDAFPEDHSRRPRHGRSRRVPDSPGEVFMLSQTTEAHTTQHSQGDLDLLLSSQPSFTLSLAGADASREARPDPTPPAGPPEPRLDTTPSIIESDYLPWPGDPPYPHPLSSDGKTRVPPPSPIDPCTAVRRALEFECRTSALNASAMILLLRPLVPADVVDGFRATAILRQHHSRLTKMGLFVEAALLRNLCVRGWPEGLPDWGESYPAIFGPVQDKVKVSYACASCHRPRDPDRHTLGEAAVWTCERCRAPVGPCAVCGHREPVAEAQLATWFYCPGCGHGGHSSCMQTWNAPRPVAAAASFGGSNAGSDEPPSPISAASLCTDSSESSDGCCPLDGCGHACLPGRYRYETTAARSEQVGRAAADRARSRSVASIARDGSNAGEGWSGSRIVNDMHDVPTSRAVESVREVLGREAGDGGTGFPGEGIATPGGNAATAASTSSLFGTSPGRIPQQQQRGAQGDRERRKSVKFAAAEI